MSENRSRNLLVVAFAGALLVVGVVAAVSYHSLVVLGKAHAEAERDHASLSGLVRLYVRMEQAESGATAFIETGDRAHLEIYREGAEKTPVALAEMRRHAGDNPECRACLQTLEPLVRRRLTSLAEMVNARAKGEAKPRSDELAGDAKVLPAIRGHLRDLWQKGEAYAGQDLARVELARDTERILVGGGALSLTLLVAVFVALLREISARRRAQAILEDREAGMRAIVDNAIEAIITVDERGIIQSFNPAAERIFDYRAQEIVGRNCTILMPLPYQAEHDRYIARYLATGEKRVIGIGREVVGMRRDGSTFSLELSVSETWRQGRRLFTGIARDITERKQVAEDLRKANEDLAAKVGELEIRTHEIGLFGQMGDLLQSALSAGEAHAIIADFARQLFPGTRGALCVADTGRRLVEVVSTWGGEDVGERVFGPDDCWALRNGRPHWVEGAVAGGVCEHVGRSPLAAYACLPMSAQGEILGTLHLRCAEPGAIDAAHRKLAAAFAEQVALALANIRLKETLRRQAVRDPLTGLYNRRYLEEALERDLRRAVRKGAPVGILMLDLDHFKDFNDNHGHAAGDALLRAFAAYLLESVRVEDIACRYGGEEFALILADATLDRSVLRAEQIREGTAAVSVDVGGRRLEGVTVSIGVAALPNHGTTSEDLLRAADAALYTAKAEGRNCVRAAPQR